MPVTVTALSASAAIPAREIHNGGVVSAAFASGNVTYGGANDVMLLAKIPNQARICGLFGNAGCAATSVTARLVLMRADTIGGGGTLGTLSIMDTVANTVTVVTAGTNLLLGAGLHNPARVSLSDNAAVQFAVLGLVATAGTQSTSFSINGVVLYETRGDTF